MTNPKVTNLSDIPVLDVNKKIFEQDYAIEKYSDGKYGAIKCIKIETIEQFDYLCKKLYSLEHKKSTIYRGQSNYNWKLNSSLEREIDKCLGEKITSEDYSVIRDEHLKHFKEIARGKIKDQTLLKANNSVDDDNELWAIAQHFGLKTPLIDWSRCFGVALFFAFNSDDDCEYRTVYRMITDYIKLSENALIEPVMDYYGRLTAQNGLFTYWGLDYHLQKAGEVLNNYLESESKKNNLDKEKIKAQVITKYYISNSLKPEINKYLKSIGITYQTIYPDLQGCIDYGNKNLIKIIQGHQNETQRTAD